MATYIRLNGVTLIVAAEETSNLHENHTECWGASHSGLHGNLYHTERRHTNSCRRGNLKSSLESHGKLRGFTQWSPWQQRFVNTESPYRRPRRDNACQLRHHSCASGWHYCRCYCSWACSPCARCAVVSRTSRRQTLRSEGLRRPELLRRWRRREEERRIGRRNSLRLRRIPRGNVVIHHTRAQHWCRRSAPDTCRQNRLLHKRMRWTEHAARTVK
jgi:hypothetical protein